MNPSQFGPFANIAGIALALSVVFSTMLFKSLGKFTRWTELAGQNAPFIVTGPARVVCVAVMAVTYVTISPSNYLWFGGAAVTSAVFACVCVISFENRRRRFVLGIPQVGHDGSELHTARGLPAIKNVVIGSEAEMRPTVFQDFERARQAEPALTVQGFMKGYGVQMLNDPEALWSREVLATHGTQLNGLLILIAILAVLTMFMAAFIVDVYRTSHT